MKTKEELNVMKEEFRDLNNKVSELADNDLEIVSGGTVDSAKTIKTAIGTVLGEEPVDGGISIPQPFIGK